MTSSVFEAGHGILTLEGEKENVFHLLLSAVFEGGEQGLPHLPARPGSDLSVRDQDRGPFIRQRRAQQGVIILTNGIVIICLAADFTGGYNDCVGLPGLQAGGLL